jgi:agmatinase
MLNTLPEGQRFLGLDDAHADPEKSQCVIVPIPYERTSSYGFGSKLGPQAILDASRQVELFDSKLLSEPYAQCNGICTAQPMQFNDAESESNCVERIRLTTKSWLDEGKFVVSLGGEHMTSLGCILAHHERIDDLTIIQLDAHSDLRDQYEGSPYNHACVMKRLLDQHVHFIQVGIRSQEKEEYLLQKKHNLPVFYAHEINDKSFNGQDSWIQDVIAVARKNVYITFDCDVFDPSILPATGTPEPGGLNWYQVTRFLEALIQWRNLVGIDFSELAPIEGLHHPQFTIAKLIQRIIGMKLSHSDPF